MSTSTFDTTSPAPRINSSMSATFAGRRVLLVGKAVDGDKLQCADDGVVTVKFNGSLGPMTVGSTFEITGVMESDGIREESRTNFRENFGTLNFIFT